MTRKSLASFPDGGIASVFGSTGGIGRAVADQLEGCSRVAQVLRFSRATDPAVDLEDEGSLARAAAFMSGLGEIRLVFDATGFLHDEGQAPEKTWGQISGEGLARAFAVNAIGPALIMKHVLPAMPREGKSVFATLSARVGSIGDNGLGGWYGYRASKAALNQLVRTAAIELKRRTPHAVCVALHPGTVDTTLSAPFRKHGVELQTPRQAAERLLGVLDTLGPEQSGCFFDHRGEAVPW